MSTTSGIFATVLALSTALVGASPIISGNINTAMPFLSDAPAWTSSAQVWWTPDATQTQSQWDWQTWSQSSVASTPATLVQSTPVATSIASSAPVVYSSWTSAQVVSSSASSVPYSNPFTVYTTQTNSAGVITGMPAVVTSQPSEAPKATVCSGCASVLSDQASWSSMVGSLYTTATPVAAAANATESSGSSRTSGSASSTSEGFSQSTGTNAASRREVLNGGAVLAIFGAAAYLL